MHIRQSEITMEGTGLDDRVDVVVQYIFNRWVILLVQL
jgi:hypothetical protein